MSDLYCAILNEDKIPEEPNEEMFLGSIDLHEHKSLETIFNLCKKNGVDLLYFDDVYLEPKNVKKMLDIFESYKIADKTSLAKKSYEKMLSILKTASEKQCGILSYCD